MLFALDLIVVLFLFVISLRAALKAFRTRVIHSADIICGVLFIFYGLPLVYDWFISPAIVPDHIYLAWSSYRVRFIYDIVLLSTVVLIKLGAHRRSSADITEFKEEGFSLVPMQPVGAIPTLTFLAWCLMFLPIVSVLLLSSDPAAYLSYGSVVELRHYVSQLEKLAMGFIGFALAARYSAIFFESCSVINPSEYRAILLFVRFHAAKLLVFLKERSRE